MPRLGFWFEFGSAYSYLSAAQIAVRAAEAGVEVSWEPFLLGPIFASHGPDSPFNVYPAKGRYMWRDVERRCEEYGVPFEKPSAFPRNSLLAARVACLAKEEPWLPEEFVRAVFRANFAEGRDISDEAVISGILENLGLPGEELIERSQSPENKESLRKQTERAVELGIFGAPIFGAPSFVANGELFWGDDRMEESFARALNQRMESRA